MEPKKIEVIGEKLDQWYNIIIDNKNLLLPWTNFKIFSILAMFRYVGINSGWVDKAVIYYPPDQTARNIYRTKIIIQGKRKDLKRWEFTENDRIGYYRLLSESEAIKIDWRRLRKLNDNDLNTVIKSVT